MSMRCDGNMRRVVAYVLLMLTGFASGCVSPAADWTDFEDGLRRCHAVFWCDVRPEANRAQFIIRRVWRKSPDILTTLVEGDVLALPCLEGFQEFSARLAKREGKTLQAFLMLSDVRRVVGQEIYPPLKPEEEFGCYGVWGWDGRMAGNIAIEDAVRRIDSDGIWVRAAKANSHK